MKGKLSIIAILICAILFFSSCEKEKITVSSSESGEEYTSCTNAGESIGGADSLITETTTEKSGNLSPNTEDNPSIFTYEQAVSDCEYLFDSLKNDYPFEGVLYRKYGLTLDSLKAKFMAKLSDQKDNMNIEKFAFTLKETINAFQGLAHLALIDYSRYKDLKVILRQFYGSEDERYSVFRGEKTSKVYEYFSSNSRRSFLATPATGKVNESDEILLKTLGEDIAYMKIPSMKSGTELEKDHIQITEFYKSISDYKNLIIDITGNGGGDDWYWIMNIVRPNISEPVITYHYFFMKCSEKNLRYFEQTTGKSVYEYKEELSITDDLPMLNPEDYKLFGTFFRSSLQVSPLNEEEQLFKGDIYLLVDRVVYSSAESSAMFCHQIGFAYIVGKGTGT
jgi:hypothetical protein